jgi:suppressor of ftsI
MRMANGQHQMDFMVNGKAFDMQRVDLTSKLGEVELWELVNDSHMDHPFHIHGCQFQVIEHELNGVKTPAPMRAWKDTVNLRPRETVRVKMAQPFKGLRMFHCHILEHEDQGMMGILQVV